MTPLQVQARTLIEQLGKSIVGQHHLVERMLVALLADGHLLVEGAPGLAKTRAIKALAGLLEGDYQRVQFTPDLLPADLTGADIYRPETHTFEFRRGPLFHNLVLADEINRAPAKVQSALLEAMAERQITVGNTTHSLPDIFMVMATQNPIEQEGTYPLPEAQLDRFLLKVLIDYPAAEEELAILRLARAEASGLVMMTPAQTVVGRRDGEHGPVDKVPANPAVGQSAASPDDRRGGDVGGFRLNRQDLTAMRQAVLQTHMAESLEHYIVSLVAATRRTTTAGEAAPWQHWIDYGASPRASIALDRCARALAWIRGKTFVTPADIQDVAPDVLRHRLLLSYRADAEGCSPEEVIAALLDHVPVP